MNEALKALKAYQEVKARAEKAYREAITPASPENVNKEDSINETCQRSEAQNRAD